MRLNPMNKKNPFMRLLVSAVFSAGAALGLGWVHGYYEAMSALNQKEPSAQTEIQRVSRVEYERLKPGMSLAEVEAILDRGTEIKRSATTATFVWENADGSSITASFQNDLLINKEQSKLR